MPFQTKILPVLLSLLTLSLAGCPAPAPQLNPPVTPPPALHLSQRPGVALALGGGGARGVAHVGVIKVLEEEDIPINLIVGCSAGSIVGALYADHRNINKVQRLLMETSATDLLDFSPSWMGAVTGNALQNFIIRNSHARYFNQLQIPFVAVATDLKTGAIVPISSGPVAPAVNASAALPPVFPPVHLYNRTLVDGGVTDLIPVDIAKHYHPKIIIAVDISPDPTPAMPTSIVGVFNRAYALSDNRFAQYNMEQADIKLHPYVGQAGTFDSSAKAALLHAGETAARQALPQICALLKANNIHSRCS